MYSYFFYGLKITSELIITAPEVPFSGETDVFIRLDKDLQPQVRNSTKIRDFYIPSHQRVDIKCEFGWISVQHGKTIRLKLNQSADIAAAIPYILGSGLGLILIQRQTLVLHASAVVKNQEAILFAGQSGHGKSSTAALLQQHGYEFMADDLSVVHFKGEEAWVQPGLPIQKISYDVIDEVHHPVVPGEKPIAEGREKYVRTSRTFYPQPVRIAAVYCIERSLVDRVKTLPKTDIERFHLLYRNSYRFQLIAPLRFAEKHLTLCRQLFLNTQVYSLTYPKESIDLPGVLKTLNEVPPLNKWIQPA